MKKIFLAAFPAGAAAALYFWYFNNSNAPFGSFFADRMGLAMALGRLAGIVAALGVMGQLLLISRAKWLEPLWGLDRLTRWHHAAGLVIPLALLVHPPLVVWHHVMQTGNGFLAQYFAVLRWEDVLAAACGEFLILAAVLLSLPFARRRLSYEAWHSAHLGAYLGLALSIGHQLELGFDLSAQPPHFAWTWYALLCFTAANVLWYRQHLPFLLYKKHRFAVDRVVMETDDVMSVHVKGERLEAFAVEPGQFALLRFWAPGFKLQAHPFSFSRQADGSGLRFSVKKLGDFTAALHAGLKPGVPVIIDGPHGVFTARRMKTNKALLVAGGIGITPLRAIAAGLAADKKDCVLVFANRARKDIVFEAELAELERSGPFRVFHVLSDEPSWPGEKGRVDAALLKRLVPDLAQRDAFLCGPPPMMAALRAGLKGLGVPAGQVHYEQFSL
ncbi:MAG TPA: ferredoxin reductase family protein [Elusimicrobiales bacterium]|nr:ferredoxin reductase family protein [Elusimicrobiales bacterium]